jgi:hypothetical protein
MPPLDSVRNMPNNRDNILGECVGSLFHRTLFFSAFPLGWIIHSSKCIQHDAS